MVSKSIVSSIALVLLGALSMNNAEPTFQKKIMSRNFFVEETKITCLLGDSQVGSLRCVQLPFSCYILHSFYINPEHRSKGYGKDLLAYACNGLKKARTILIQPGPYEIENNKVKPVTEPTERAARLTKLCKLYSTVGFRTASSPLSFFAALIYKLAGIPENAYCLMQK